MNIREALEAIKAREAGVWDNPALVAFGPLLVDPAEDIIRIKIKALEGCGFEVGARDPRLNTKYTGRFMVLECRASVPPGEHAEGQDCGSWCIVGDDLGALVTEAFDVAQGIGYLD